MVKSISFNPAVKASPLKKAPAKQNVAFEGRKETSGQPRMTLKQAAAIMSAATVLFATSCKKEEIKPEPIPEPPIEEPEVKEVVFDKTFNPQGQYFYLDESADLTGINNIKINDSEATEGIAIMTNEPHEKYILVNLQDDKTNVLVGGTNNTIEIANFKPGSDAKIMISKLKSHTEKVENGNVYLELNPVDDKYSTNTKVNVLLGKSGEMSQPQIDEAIETILTENIQGETAG